MFAPHGNRVYTFIYDDDAVSTHSPPHGTPQFATRIERTNLLADGNLFICAMAAPAIYIVDVPDVLDVSRVCGVWWSIVIPRDLFLSTAHSKCI